MHSASRMPLSRTSGPKKHSRGCTSCGSLRNSTCQRQWRCTCAPPSSPPPSLSGMLLPLPRIRENCSMLYTPQRRWLAALYHPSTITVSSRLQLASSTRPPLTLTVASHPRFTHYINVKSTHLNKCVTLTHIFWTVSGTLQIFSKLNTVNNIFTHYCTTVQFSNFI